MCTCLCMLCCRWSGISVTGGECPARYPAGAPRSNCQHISLVELDAQMAYKMVRRQCTAYYRMKQH
jgi:hypothetical protein